MADAAAENGYGTLGYINSFQLAVTFALVVLFAVMSDESLNHLEKWAHKAGFQELFQRIYRELMVMGTASFAMNVVSASSGDLFGTWEFAYYFTDNIIFLISMFFSLQGIGVMAVSLIDANSWDRASKIDTEELLLDVENEMRINSFSWRNTWYPYNRTRNQVEFRVFNLIFSRMYRIGGGNDVFNFGYYLRLSHQRNVIDSIDITPLKWLVVTVLVALISLYYEMDLFGCADNKCFEAWSIYVFMVFGYSLVIISILTCYVARVYELKLLAMNGVTSISEYDIYLESERTIKKVVERSLMNIDTVLNVLAQLEVEKDIDETKKINQRMLFRRSSVEVARDKVMSLMGRQSSRPTIFPEDGSRVIDANRYAQYAATSSRPQSVAADSHRSMQAQPSHRSVATTASGLVVDVNSPASTREENFTSDNNIANIESDFDSKVREFKSSVKYFEDEAPIKSPNDAGDDDSPSVSTKAPVRNIKRRKSIFDIYVEKKVLESVIVTMQGKTVSPFLSNQNAASIRNSSIPPSPAHARKASVSTRETSVKCPPIDDAVFEKHKLFMKVELEEGEQYLRNFRHIFYRGQPEVFFAAIHMIMLCSTLYMAWWLTTLVFYITANHSTGETFLLCVLTLIPPVVIFPMLTLLMRRTTLFKALMRLDPTITTNTILKAQSTTNSINALRQNLKIRLLGLSEDEETISKNAVMDLFEDIDSSGDMNISFDEFHLMLSRLNLHISKAVAMEIFSSCDSNHTGSLSVEEFERFVFPDESAEADRKRENYFNAKNKKDIAAKKKSAVSERMIHISEKLLSAPGSPVQSFSDAK